jgi:hypothetical protein
MMASDTSTIASTTTIVDDSNNIVSPPSVNGALIGGIVGGVLGGLLLIGAIVGLACFFSRRSSSNEASSHHDVPLSSPQPTAAGSEYGSVGLVTPTYNYDAPPITSTMAMTDIYGPAPPEKL